MTFQVYWIYILIIAGCLACDNRDKYFEGLNAPPVLQLQSNGNAITEDSVKISLKSGKNSTTFNATAVDNNFKLLSVKFNTGNGKVKINGVETFSTEAIAPVYAINVSPTAVGVNEVEVSASDAFDQIVSDRVRITAFVNMEPVAKLAVRQIRNFTYELDATASFDKDKAFGGKISLYSFTIEGSVIEVANSKITYNFGKPGNYNILMVVKDNDGTVSETLRETLEVK